MTTDPANAEQSPSMAETTTSAAPSLSANPLPKPHESSSTLPGTKSTKTGTSEGTSSDSSIPIPPPFELEHPELAEHLRLIANGIHPAVKTVWVQEDAFVFRLHEIDKRTGKERMIIRRREQPKIGRNDPCRCGSGKKFKKCCGR